MKIWNLGYPRLGVQKKWWGDIRAFEHGEISEETLLELGKKELEVRWKTQHEMGLDSIPLNDFPFWDSVLDAAWLFGLVPRQTLKEESWVSAQRDLVLGNFQRQVLPLNLGKWFQTGYRCLLPEWAPKKELKLERSKLDWELSISKTSPYTHHLALIGPWTLAQFCQLHGRSKTDLLQELTPLYTELFRDLKKRGLGWIQVDEPSFCADLEKVDISQIEKTYGQMAQSGAKILLTPYFDSPDPWLTQITQLPAFGFHFDLVQGPAVLSWIKTRAFPKDKILSLGLVNAQNIWASPLASLYKQVELLKGFHSENKLLLAPSGPLSFLPQTIELEEGITQNPQLRRTISFADQRLAELNLLKKALGGQLPLSELESLEAQSRKDLTELKKLSDSLKGSLSKVDLTYRRRPSSFAKRVKIQAKKMGLPRLPMTLTSLADDGRKQNTPPASVESVIAFQDQYQMDVLLPDAMGFQERLDLGAQSSEGWLTTGSGWVPISARECIKPLIQLSNIEWKVWDSAKRVHQAQILSNRIVKGVIVGAISSLNHAFLRPEMSLESVLLQSALWVRTEMKHLEQAGIRVIQVDEPFILDKLPIKKNRRAVFLKTIFDNLKVALSGAGDETVVHLNLSLNDLDTIKEVCGKCDVDVLSFEMDGVGLDKIAMFKGVPLECGMGPGVFPSRGIENPNEKDIEMGLRKTLTAIVPDKAWIILDSAYSQRCLIPKERWLQPLMIVTLLFRKALSSSR